MRLRLFALVLPFTLAACYTDVLSTKPETDARLPERSIEAPAAPIEETAPEPEPVIDVLPEPITESPPSPDPSDTSDGETDTRDTKIPYTTKLVRGIINGGEIILNTNDTLTLAISANRNEGYSWELEQPAEGLVIYGDYYRIESPFPDRTSIGGARYFLLRADKAGTYPIRLKHVRGEDVRVTKSFSVNVSDPS